MVVSTGWQGGTLPSGPAGRRAITPLWLTAFLVVLMGLVILLDWAGATTKVDRLLHDGWVRISQRPTPDNIVIVAIDPQSLAAVGGWPWPRATQVQLFERLGDFDLEAVVIDLLYVEPDGSPLLDIALAEAIGNLPNAVLPVLTEGRLGPSTGEKLPISELSRVIDDLGHIFLPIDDDGIVRRVHLKSGFKAAHWPTLALAAEQQLRGEAFSQDALPGRRIAKPLAPNEWVQDFEVMIPFFGPSGSFHTVSAVSVLDGSVDPAQLNGKTVFVGMTATGLTDLVPTPVSALDRPVPGVEIHANVLAGLRAGCLVTRIDERWNLLVAGVLLPLLLLMYSRGRPAVSLVGTFTGSLLPVLLSYGLYHWASLWYAPLSTSVPVLMGYFLWSWHRLDFVNGFLEQESRVLDPHLPLAQDNSDAQLSGFFEHATLHLPIAAWSVRIDDRRLHGGEPVVLARNAGGEPMGSWTRYGDVYRKRYQTPDRLQIRVRIPDANRAREILDYIDSLARIRRRAAPQRLAGSIERLQNTAQKLSEKTAWLRSVKVFTETIMASSPAGFAVWNPAGEMLRSNALLYKMVPGLPEKPLLAEFLSAIGRQPSVGADARLLQALMLEGAPWQLTLSAGERECIVNLNAAGQTLAERLISVVMVDVSDIRTSERARAEMVDYLSHDLRSPLISALYLVDSEPNEALPRAERDQRIEANIRQSLAMMDKLLHVARADNLSADHFSELLFDAVIDNALDQLIPQARARGITIDVDIDDESHFWMQGDASSLERAVVNVLGNAIKYSYEGGQVRVRACRVDQATEEGSASFVELSMEDDGVGIDPALCVHVFQRFRRDDKVADDFPGIGLGLALVSRVVNEHGGSVVAEPASPGTRVIIRLPLDPDA